MTILHELRHVYDGASEQTAYQSELDFLNTLKRAIENGDCPCLSNKDKLGLLHAIKLRGFDVENAFGQIYPDSPPLGPGGDWTLPDGCPFRISPTDPQGCSGNGG